MVTGASGFLGRPLVSALVHANYAVRAATRTAVPLPPAVDIVIVPDFAERVDWDRVLQGADIVIHAAGLAHADVADRSAAYDRINRITTEEIASAAARARVERFVFISSVRAQAGASADRVLREADEPRPTDAYGRSKLAAEAAVRAAGLPYTILRPVVMYGPHAKANFRMLARIAASAVPLPFAALRNRRSLLCVDNLVSAILFTLENPATAGETYLVADSEALSVRDIFSMLRRAQGRAPALVYVPEPLIRFGLIMIGLRGLWERIGGELIVDTHKLESAGWRPPVDTYSGLSAMLPADRPGIGSANASK